MKIYENYMKIIWNFVKIYQNIWKLTIFSVHLVLTNKIAVGHFSSWFKKNWGNFPKILFWKQIGIQNFLGVTKILAYKFDIKIIWQKNCAIKNVLWTKLDTDHIDHMVTYLDKQFGNFGQKPNFMATKVYFKSFC